MGTDQDRDLYLRQQSCGTEPPKPFGTKDPDTEEGAVGLGVCLPSYPSHYAPIPLVWNGKVANESLYAGSM